MPKCGICGGETLRQPAINEDGSCEFCGRGIVLRE